MASHDRARVEQHWHRLPTFHLKAPHGWLNDPCGPGFDSSTGIYHLFYQWNPKTCDWGDISWGHVTSRDGIHWSYNGTEPVLKPDKPYDKEGIFTGCLYPSGPKGQQGQLTLIYSSACYLPIQWATPYKRNCCGLAGAISQDGGKTWQKCNDSNPILDGEPEDLTVTGFRDPYLAKWPALDKVRNEESLYGVVPGGINGKGGVLFLYAIPHDNLFEWQYLGPLLQLPLRFRSFGRWGLDFGTNWECASFMTLGNGSEERQFLVMGSEGGLKPGCTMGDDSCYIGHCLWLAGSLNMKDRISMTYEFGGLLDHGCFYAASSYEHPISKKRIVWGWLKEEEITLGRRESKGWTGFLSIPRELFYLSIPDVVGTIGTPLSEISCIHVTNGEEKDTKTVHTLGIRALLGFETLRPRSATEWANLSHSSGKGTAFLSNSTSWEIEAIIRIPPTKTRIGFHIQHNQDLSQRTTISFDNDKEEIKVDRSCSNQEDDIKKDDNQGPFTLFKFRQNGIETLEKLHLRIFGDRDVVEIFANDRFAMSTMAYSNASECTGISVFEESAQPGGAIFESIKIWDIQEKVLLETQV